jgi:hypothetical protein
MKIKWVYLVVGFVILVLGSNLFTKNNKKYPALPQQYLDDRENFGKVNQFFTDAMNLTKPPNDSGESFDMPPDQQSKILSDLQEGVNLSKQIDDGFLDYLDPSLKSNFRDKYVAGNELFMEGLKSDTSNEKSIGVQKQLEGNKLIGEWISWWNKNRDNITNKAFAK